MLRRRLTALLATLAFLPAALAAGRDECVMDALAAAERDATVPGADHAAHRHGRHTSSPRQHTRAAHIGDDTGSSDMAPASDVPGTPTECVLLMGCGSAVAPASVAAIEQPTHVASGVGTDVASAPDSPTLGLEPPPPRA